MSSFLKFNVKRPFILVLFMLTSLSVFAQPQYYNNASTKGSETASPLYGGGMDRAQWVFGPGTFKSAGTSGTAAKAGKIENIYFMLGSKIFDPQLYEFTVKLGQNVGTDTVWADTTWNTGMTTVYFRAERKVTDTQWAWIQIPLQEHFVYNPNLSLVLEMSMTSGHGATIRGHMVSGKVSINGLLGESTGRNTLGLLPNFGFDMTNTDPYNAGVSKLTAPFYFCDGTHDVKVDIVNNGTKPLDSVRINWSIDGIAQPVIYYKNSIDTFEGSGANRVNVTLGQVAFPTGVKKDIKVWTSHPNGVQDSTNEDDTLAASFMPALNGSYTIGGTGADFASFSDAATYLNNYGVCGPVKFKAATGTYKEQLILKRIGGVSATNTITIEGSDRTNTIIEHKGTNRNDWQTVLLHGVNYVTLRNLTIEALDSTWSIGIHIIDADSNTIDSCDIVLHDNSYSVKLYGIAGSGTPWETLPGNSGHYNTFSNLKITGGYIGINYAGASSFILSIGNKFIGNSITGYLREGINLLGHGKVTIDSNYIANRTDQWATSWGLYLSAIADFTVTRNVIHTKNLGMDIWFPNYYYQYSNPYGNISNNMVVSGACLQFSYARHVKLHHNSFSVPASGGGCLSIRYCDTLDIQNNLFKNLAKSLIIYIFCSPVNTFGTFDNNVYYAPDYYCGPVVYECGTATCFSSLSNWFSSVTSKNQNSIIEEPKFISSTDLHLQEGYRPTGPNLGILDDIDGRPRCLLSPTIGAHEVINGTLPDTSNPVNICAGDTLTYELLPPKGLTNSDYGTKWKINLQPLQTAGGTITNNYTILNPSSSGDGKISFHPQASDVDSSFFLSMTFINIADPGCDSTFGKYIRVFPQPKAAFSIAKSEICLGDSITLTNLSTVSPGIKYLWGMGTNETLEKPSFSYTYKEGGVFRIRLVAYTPACMDSVSKIITVGSTAGSDFAKGTPFNGYMQVGTVNNPDNLCAGDTLTYEILPPEGYTNAHYNTHWKVADVRLTKPDGSTIQDTITIKPDSIHNFRIRFIANGNLSGDTLVLKVTLSSLSTNSCPDTTLSRYIAIGFAPEVAFGFTPGCFGQGFVKFYDSSTIEKGLLGRQWDFGDGSTSNIKFASHTYAKTGQYQVRLIITSDKGCTNVLTKMVQVNDPPNVNFGYTEQCSGLPFSFFDSTVTAGTISSRLWKFGDGSTDTAVNPQHIYKNAGNYLVTLVVNASTNCTDSIRKNIIVKERPVAGFSYVANCRNMPLKFTNNSKAPTGTTLSYKWDFGDGVTSDSANPSHTYLNTGTYKVKLMAISTNGCKDTFVKNVDLLQHPIVSFTPDLPSVCSGETLTFSDSTSPNGTAYFWDFGDGTTSTAVKGSHIYNSPGIYSVKLKVINFEGCADSAFRTVQVYEKPIADFDSDTVCQGESTHFKNFSQVDPGAIFFWDFGDGMTSTDKSPEYSFSNAGPYTVELVAINQNGGCSDTQSRSVVVRPLPDASFTISYISPTQKQFTPSYTGYANYLWYFGDGDSSDSASPIHTYPGGKGNYQVKLITTNKEGCKAEYSVLIQIDVGIREENADNYRLVIYPNPFSHSTSLSFILKETSRVTIQLCDMLGRHIENLEQSRKEPGKYNYEINANKLGMAPGIYNLRILIDGLHINRQIILN